MTDAARFEPVVPLGPRQPVEVTTEPMRFPSWIPADVRAQLDPGEFASYESDLAADADALAARFEVFIATYAARPRVETHFTHLCRTFASASLSPQALEALRGAEQRHSGVTFVAYAKPLQRQT